MGQSSSTSRSTFSTVPRTARPGFRIEKQKFSVCSDPANRKTAVGLSELLLGLP
jgi:hypothetical protein